MGTVKILKEISESFILSRISYFIMCMSVLACISVYHMNIPGARESQKRELDTLELEFWRSQEGSKSSRTIVADGCEPPWDAGNQTPFFCKDKGS